MLASPSTTAPTAIITDASDVGIGAVLEKWCQSPPIFFEKRKVVPPALREAVASWCHFGRFGCHHGVIKTRRRVARFCWWPELSKSVDDIVSRCLPCARYRPVNLQSLRGTLTKPALLDFVGPRQWLNRSYYILTIVDHCSRLLVAEVTAKQTADFVVEVLATKWVPYFGSAEAFLVDRGPQFVSQRLRDYVTKDLQAVLLHTSPAYPQGNGVNEAVHRVLEHTVACRSSVEHHIPFDELVRDAVLAYNAAPHGVTGQPPFFLLTGQDLLLPGMIRFRPQKDKDGEVRHPTLRELTMRARIDAATDREKFSEASEEIVKEGDVVLYKLTEYERRNRADHSASSSAKYLPLFSRRCRVLSATTTTATVKDLWAAAGVAPRQVPLTQIRKFAPQFGLERSRIRLDQTTSRHPLEQEEFKKAKRRERARSQARTTSASKEES